jgi:hypothetical protein
MASLHFYSIQKIVGSHYCGIKENWMEKKGFYTEVEGYTVKYASRWGILTPPTPLAQKVGTKSAPLTARAHHPVVGTTSTAFTATARPPRCPTTSTALTVPARKPRPPTGGTTNGVGAEPWSRVTALLTKMRSSMFTKEDVHSIHGEVIDLTEHFEQVSTEQGAQICSVQAEVIDFIGSFD